MTRKIVYLGLAGLLFASVAVAEQLYLKSDTDLLPQKDAAATPITLLRRGTQINVLGHEGNWLKMQSGNDQGYIYNLATQEDQPGAFTGLSTGQTASATAAGRGFDATLGPDATAYAQGKNLNTQPMNDLLAFRKLLGSPEMLQQLHNFRVVGHVGLDNP